RIGLEWVRHVVQKVHPRGTAKDDLVVVFVLGEGAVVALLQRLQVCGIQFSETIGHRARGYRRKKEARRPTRDYRRASLSLAAVVCALRNSCQMGNDGHFSSKRHRHMPHRQIPKTGEEVPVIGLGTWRTFDVASERARKPLAGVLDRFAAAGGRVIDTSPMYGKAEEAIGELKEHVKQPFLATKVWTQGREAGIEQMKRAVGR